MRNILEFGKKHIWKFILSPIITVFATCMIFLVLDINIFINYQLLLDYVPSRFHFTLRKGNQDKANIASFIFFYGMVFFHIYYSILFYCFFYYRFIIGENAQYYLKNAKIKARDIKSISVYLFLCFAVYGMAFFVNTFRHSTQVLFQYITPSLTIQVLLIAYTTALAFILFTKKPK